MIIVHPNDPSTVMLKPIYEGIKNVTIFDSWTQKDEIIKAIAAAPKDEPILLLGHGSPSGLYDVRVGLLIDDDDAHLLKDRQNLVGIWCYASTYAYRHGLKGFFSGMFISELEEAWSNGVRAKADEINRKAWDFSRRFGDMLKEGKPLGEIAAELQHPLHQDSELTFFNYSRLAWRPAGDEPLSEVSAKDE